MGKYKVVAYSATLGKKVFKAHSIIEASDADSERIAELIKGKYIIPYDDEEELKAQIKVEEALKKKALEDAKEKKEK